MVNREYQPQARLSQHLKDVRLMRSAASAAGLELPLSAAHQAVLEQAEALGFGDRDNSALIEVWRQARLQS
jgi:3-hydroxyisobutyrate dehydrogenase-like beta-hydroxyacid dehydrogenase